MSRRTAKEVKREVDELKETGTNNEDVEEDICTQLEFLKLVPDLIRKLNRIERHQKSHTVKLKYIIDMIGELPENVVKEVNQDLDNESLDSDAASMEVASMANLVPDNWAPVAAALSSSNIKFATTEDIKKAQFETELRKENLEFKRAKLAMHQMKAREWANANLKDR